MKHKYKISFLLTGLLCFGSSVFAQKTYVNREWENTTGTIGSIHRTASALDNNQNLIVVSNTLNTSNNTDVLITKYNPDGVVLWQQTFDGSAHGNDYAVQLKINNANEIFVASTLTENTGIDFGLLKYSSNGTLVWSSSWNGSANGVDVPADLDIDNSGNIYLVGGSGTSIGTSDYAIVKFNSNGTYQWHTNYDYANLHDVATSLDFNTNSIVVTGASASTPTNWDFATLKINTTNGSIVQTERTVVAGVGLDNAVAVTTDANNNTYITGYVEVNGNRNIQTVKLNANFGLEWVNNFEGGLEDLASAIGVDYFGNVYIAGTKENSNGGKDYITIKYDQNGNEVWNREFGSEGNNFTATAENLAILDNGDVVVTGTLDKNNVKEFATVKYTSAGDLKFVQKFDAGNQNNEAKSVIVKNNAIYVSGISEINGTNQNATVKYSTNKRTITPVVVNGIESHVDDEIIVSFSKDAMIYSAVNDKDFNSGKLNEFVKPAVIQALQNQNSDIDWDKVTAYRIFDGLTTNDSLSTTRTGHIIEFPHFWSTLVLSVQTENETLLAESISQTVFPYVKYAQINGLFELTVDDPQFPAQHTLMSTIYPDGHINILPAWAIETGKSNIKVGVYDTGIMFKHQEFGGGINPTGKIRGGKDYWTGGDLSTIPNFGDPINSGTNGHGTKVAGIIGAYSDNTTGIAGIAGGRWPHLPGESVITDPDPTENEGVSLYAFKLLFGVPQFTADMTASALIEGSANTNGGYGYALDILNCSFTRTINAFDDASFNFMFNAQRTCFRNGSVMVAGKGNTGTATYSTPAYARKDYWVLAVGGSNEQGNKHGSSSYGNGIDIMAPYSSTMSMTTGHNSPTEYTSFSGTSQATPHVSGVVGLMLSHINDQTATVNNLAPDDVEFLINRYAQDKIFPPASIGYDEYTGHGLLDAGNVLTHIDRTQYVIKHYYGSKIFDETTSSITATDIFLNNLDDGTHPIGTYKGDRYVIWDSHNNNLNTGDVIIDSWPLKSYTNMIIGDGTGNGSEDYEKNMLLGAVNFNTTVWEGHTFHVTEDPNGNVVDFWYPIAPGDEAKYGYTLHLQSAFASVDETDGFNLSCFPNPTSNELNINFSLTENSNVEINLIDLQGKTVKSNSIVNYNKGQQNVKLNVNNLANGIYFVKIKVNENIYYEKIIKQ